MDLVPLFLTALLVFILSAYLYKILSRRYKYIKQVDILPGPPALPLIGNALDNAVPRNQLMKTWLERTRKYAPIYRSWGGPLAMIHLSRPEHIEIILNSTKHIDKSLVYKFLLPWLGTGLLTSTGAKWHSHRKMITPTFHFKILDSFVEVFVNKSQILVEKLKPLCTDKAFDLYPFITRCAMDIICETAMGIEINAQCDTKSDYVSAIYEVSELTILRTIRPWLWHPLIFNWTNHGKRYNKCLEVLHGFTNKVIQERKQVREGMAKNGESGKVAGNEEDEFLGNKKRLAFLDLLLEASQSSKTPLTDVEIREEVDTFMFEGHDTTTAGICWSLFLLGSHLECQEKVFAELDAIFEGDNDRRITMRDLNKMKYLERVIKESLRLFPSVPFIGRRLTEDTQFDQYLVPAGTYVSVEIFNVHRSPDQFPNPNAFNPDNFLPEAAQKRHPYAYVPFSAGPRNCIGQKFALLEEKSMLASVLRKYKVQSMEKFENLTLMNELILRPESGIQVKMTPRTPLA